MISLIVSVLSSTSLQFAVLITIWAAVKDKNGRGKK